jgi:hypothetical protein
MQHTVPVHSISFNCNDKEANEFLFDLAKATGGRYHYFSEKGKDLDQPESWEVIITHHQVIISAIWSTGS